MSKTVVRIALSILLVLGAALASVALISLAPRAHVQSTLIYSTDFENVTKIDAHHLNMGIIADYFETGGEGGASMWMEGLDRITPGITCHSVGRCVGMELTNNTMSNRITFDIHNMTTLVGDEFFVSVWLYLPADWRLHSLNDWYELIDPFYTDAPTYLPYGAVHILQPNITEDIFNIDFDIRNTSGVEVNYGHISNYPLPRGRWFNIQYYVFRHATNGAVKVWVNGSPLFDIQNISTKDPAHPEYWTDIAKIYYASVDAYSPYRIWVDDLQIYSRLPSFITDTDIHPANSAVVYLSSLGMMANANDAMRQASPRQSILVQGNQMANGHHARFRMLDFSVSFCGSVKHTTGTTP